ERKAFLDRKHHPFYRHGNAVLFLARKNGEIVGRIMASDDTNHNALHQSNVGCFGLFECIDDRDVSAALLERAASWLREKGRTEIMGPIDYSTNYTCGLLVDGFEHPPTLLTTHNPPHYEGLIANYGFSKVVDFFAWWFSDPNAATARLRKLAARLNPRARFTIRRANLRNLEAEAANFLRIYNEAWKDNWGFVPFTRAEFDYMKAEMKPVLRDYFTAVAERHGEE